MKVQERDKARELRFAGKSIREIERELGVARSSVSVWVRDINLSDEQKKHLYDNSEESRRKSLLVLHDLAIERKIRAGKIREGYRLEGRKRANDDHSFQVICALYWGEGCKARNVFALSNCDEEMLKFVGEWLIKNGYRDKITFTVQSHESCCCDTELLSRWKLVLPFLTDGMVRKFSRYGINRASQEKHIGKQPYGTARISVCDTKLVQMVYGGIEFFAGKNGTKTYY